MTSISVIIFKEKTYETCATKEESDTDEKYKTTSVQSTHQGWPTLREALS
jgi:hypothetical protein